MEAVVGRAPPAISLKVIDHLDDTALHWINRSPFMFACFCNASGVSVTQGGGAPGFVGADRATLSIPVAALDDPDMARVGDAFGSLFLAPGLGETLRVNGRVDAVEAGELHVIVTECYVHCAKALIRSGFWSAPPLEGTPGQIADFCASSSFIALASVDGQGSADLSPKGDPAGLLARLDGNVLYFADRPGNRRTDSFRNILAWPQVALNMLVPGSSMILSLCGTAELTTDETLRASFAMRGKVPSLVTKVELNAPPILRRSSAIRRAGLWPLVNTVDDIDPAAMFVAHVKLNRDKGLGARIAGAVMSVPGLMRKGLESDYRKKLY